MIEIFKDSTLKELVDKISAIVETGEGAVDTETGEVVDRAALDALNAAYEDKVNATIATIKSLRASAMAHDDEANSQKKLKEDCERRAEWLSKYLADMLAGKKWDSKFGAVSYRKTTSVQIEDELKIPTEYMKEKVTRVPDKVKLKKALANGAVPGVSLLQKVNTVIK